MDRKFSACLLSRRAKAFQHLELDMIPARVIDIDSVLLGKDAENEVRKDFLNLNGLLSPRRLKKN